MQDWYESNAARLSFRESGAGRAVIFLHPTPLDHDFWRPLIGNLGGVRAIVPDLRGHGASALGEDLPIGAFARVPDAPVLAMAEYAADILALMDHLDMQRAVLAGCSIGGYIALELWRLAPERFSALAFICSKPQSDTETGLQRRAANIASVREAGTGPLFEGMAQSLVGPTARSRRLEIVAEVRARMTLTAQAAIAVQAGLATRPDSVPTVATMDVPVLAIAGGEDSAVSPADMEAFRAAPGGCCEYHLLPDAGHFAAYEQPEKVAALLAEWLKQIE
jgi:3-oxoadipate enol-lactonase